MVILTGLKMDYDNVLRAMLDRHPTVDEDRIIDFLCENMTQDEVTIDEFKRLCEDFEYQIDAE